MGTFESSDGLVNLAAPGARLWQRFCDALGADGLRDDFKAKLNARLRRPRGSASAPGGGGPRGGAAGQEAGRVGAPRLLRRLRRLRRRVGSKVTRP